MEENKTIELGKDFKEIIADIEPEQQNETNQLFINDLKKIIQTNSTVPTYIPKKLLSCFYLYKSGADYRLYIYTDNTWKYSALS